MNMLKYQMLALIVLSSSVSFSQISKNPSKKNTPKTKVVKQTQKKVTKVSSVDSTLTDKNAENKKSEELLNQEKAPKQEKTMLAIDEVIDEARSNGSNELNTEDMMSGVREMLKVASDRTQKILSVKDGFFLDNSIKITMPEGTSKITQTLQKFGMSKLVDDVELSMNRAAEMAANEGLNVIKKEINEIDFSGILNIITSSDTGATHHLRIRSADSIEKHIKPIVADALKQSNATKYWSDLFKNYNKFAKDKVNPDLNKYVCEKMMYAFFLKIGNMEKQIRLKPDDEVQSIIKRIRYRP